MMLPQFAKCLLRKPRDHWFLGYPYHITLEFTTRCNLLCKTCGRRYILDRLEIADLTMPHLELIVNELKKREEIPEITVLAGIGEPLLNKDIDEMFGFLRKSFGNKTRLELFTNGILLNKHVDACLENLDEVVIGVNFADKQLYNEYAGVDVFDKVVDNAEMFLAEKRKRNLFKPKVIVQLLNMKENMATAQSFFEEMKPHLNTNDSLDTTGLVNFGGQLDIKPYAIEGTREISDVERYPCWQLWHHLYFGADGDVYPCCLGTPALASGGITLGNLLKERSLSRIVNNGVLRNLQKKQLCGDWDAIPICSTCNIWKRFGNVFIKLREKWH